PRDTADMLELNSPLGRERGFDRGPSQREAETAWQHVAPCGHLDGPFVRCLATEHMHPAVVGQDARPILDLGGQIENYSRIGADVAADRRVHYGPSSRHTRSRRAGCTS